MIHKAWGGYEELFLDVKYELRRLHIDRCGFCSPHWHATKSNVFDMASGTLMIRAWDNVEMNGEPTLHVLGPQDRSLCLPSYGVHQFMALTDALVYEGSMADPGQLMEPGEIHRLGESGMYRGEIKPNCWPE
jgi:hypothetical protein